MRGSLPEMVDPGKNITFPLGSTMMWTGELSHSGPKAHCPTAEGICAATGRLHDSNNTHSTARPRRCFIWTPLVPEKDDDVLPRHECDCLGDYGLIVRRNDRLGPS